MVHHRDAEREYWTLPGGGVEMGESPLEAIVREVKEETGLEAKVLRLLFEGRYSNGTSSERYYLMEVDDAQEAKLGYDPEEEHIEASLRLLQGISWHTLESMKNDCQVSRVLEHIS